MVGCIPSTCSSDTRTTAVATQTRSTCLIARHTATVHATHHSTQLHLIGLTFCLRISSLSSCILSHPHPPSAHRPMPKSQVTLNSAVLPLLVPRLPHRSLFQVCSHRISSHRITTHLLYANALLFPGSGTTNHSLTGHMSPRLITIILHLILVTSHSHCWCRMSTPSPPTFIGKQLRRPRPRDPTHRSFLRRRPRMRSCFHISRVFLL